MTREPCPAATGSSTRDRATVGDRRAPGLGHTRARRRAVGLTVGVAALVSVGCTIIIQPKPPAGPGVGVPTPLTCSRNDGVPTVDVFFAVRLERSTVNLAPRYASIMRTTVAAITAAHVLPRTATLIRLDERPVEARSVLAAWGCDLDDPGRLDPELVLRHHALASLPDSPLGCATDPLLSVLSNTAGVTTRYPSDLPGTSGRAVFGDAPSIALVVYIDATARRAGFSDPGCGSARTIASHANDDAPWLRYSDRSMPAERVVSWFITTEEGVDRDTFVARCRALSGFPSALLDNLEPSERALYGPLGDGIAERAHVANPGFCKMMVDSELFPFIRDEIHAIADVVDTRVDDDVLDAVLGGGLPNGSASDVPPG